MLEGRTRREEGKTQEEQERQVCKAAEERRIAEELDHRARQREEEAQLAAQVRHPEGSQQHFYGLQRNLLQFEAEEEVRERDLALLKAHEHLKSRGARDLREAFQRYLRGDECDPRDARAWGSLDVHLLALHGVLFEDLPEHVLERWLAKPEVFTEPAALRQLWVEVYGNGVQYPIPRVVAEAELPATACRRQFVIERLTMSSALREYREEQEKMIEDGRAADTRLVKKAWMPWVETMAKHIDELREGKRSRSTGDRLIQEVALESDLLAVLTCQTVLNQLYTRRLRGGAGGGGDLAVGPEARAKMKRLMAGIEEKIAVPFVTAVVAVGDAVELECSWRQQGGRIRQPKQSKSGAAYSAALMWRSLGSKSWDQRKHTVPVGAALVDLLIRHALIEVERSSLGPLDIVSPEEQQGKGNVKMHVFAHELQRQGIKNVGHVVLQPAANRAMDFSESSFLHFLAPKCQPMVMEPRPWRPSGETPEGGYLLHKVPFIRTSSRKMSNLKTYSPVKVARVMDMVGKTPWRINQRVLKVMEEVVKQDLAVAEVPPAEDPVVPEFPEDYKDLPEEEQKRLKIERFNAVKLRAELQSTRPTFGLKLRVAQDFRCAPQLFFPHNVDFRGRAYPVPPHLNHISDDVCRGLLEFAHPRPLGEDGFFWLKVSMANLLGKDKLPFAERVAYVDSCRSWIMEVANDPLASENIDRWAKADDGPWQALARCFELADVWSSGDEKGYLSHIPVHLDGSCNGLQHYAALGRDEWGAKAVNLTPSDRPQDVYTIVLGIVKEKVAKDAEGDDDRAGMAQRLQELDVLKRKVVKRTIMTICYGVTTVGAKAQVQGELQDMVGKTVEPEEISRLAAYLSGLVLRSIDEVFERAMLIKKWFDQVSRILNLLEVPVCWISPIGLSCSQPYKKKHTVTVTTRRQKVNLGMDGGPLVDKCKQRMGFPPNFIHSLDASHMMMVAEGCSLAGIQFAGVHDSFWTHAADASQLNRIIRQAFHDLHKKPILQELHEDMRVQVGSIANLPDLPKQGSLDLDMVLESPYIFS